MAVGAPVRELAMAVVVARRGGLHAAATRFASAGPPPAEFTALRARVLRIERDTLAACVPPSRYGDVLTVLDQAYGREGAPAAGPVTTRAGRSGTRSASSRSRRPSGTRAGTPRRWRPATRWPGTRACAGGAKAEDTYLVSPGGPERITQSTSTGPGWPAEDDELVPPRPAVLEVA